MPRLPPLWFTLFLGGLGFLVAGLLTTSWIAWREVGDVHTLAGANITMLAGGLLVLAGLNDRPEAAA